jgi:uracil-DNA glycosylase family 4
LIEQNHDENLAENFAYLRDVLGVKFLTLGAEGKSPWAPNVVAPELQLAQPDGQEDLAAIAAELVGCARCKLSRGRKNIVFGAGNPKAQLMFIGEGPGEQEDSAGEPFVGAGGQLLTKMIIAMGLSRDEVYIANVVKCRPPLDRNPESDEIAQCSPFLERQINTVNPKVVVLLGTFAAQTILNTDEKISRLRGQLIEKGGKKFIATYHPAYLLRNPGEKKAVWSDLQMAMEELGLTSTKK